VTDDIFHDGDVAAAHESGGAIACGCRTVRLPRVFGFCGGVRSAAMALQQTLERHPATRVWLLGEIIHNDTVNDYFRRRGVRILRDDELRRVSELAGPGDMFVVPAFGLPRDVDEQVRHLAATPDHIVDTTCRYVRVIWEFVERMAGQRCTVVIHGKPNHPETQATVSRALTPENAVIHIPSVGTAAVFAECIRAGSADAYPDEFVLNPGRLALRHLAVVNQTTMLYGETRQIDELLRRAAADAFGRVESLNTVCRATQLRQDAALELCREGCDAFLVIGGYSSSNTSQLHRLAREHGPAYFIRDADAIGSDQITHYSPDQGCEVHTPAWLHAGVRTVGILAGASCPPRDIGSVIRRIRELSS